MTGTPGVDWPLTPIDPPRGEPVAEVTRVGRWTWRVCITHDILTYGPDRGHGWHVLGQRRATRKGRRELARYLAKRSPEKIVIRATEP